MQLFKTKKNVGAGETALWLRALVALPGDEDLFR